MKTTLQRGFTLIELLVVIAIIGILASVVLASLNDARSSGADASTQQSLNNLRSQNEIFYNRNSFSYNGACANSGVDQLSTSIIANSPAASEVIDGGIQTATTYNCNDVAASWAAAAPMAGGGYFCVDSTGFSGSRNTALPAYSAGGAGTVCPAS